MIENIILAMVVILSVLLIIIILKAEEDAEDLKDCEHDYDPDFFDNNG